MPVIVRCSRNLCSTRVLLLPPEAQNLQRIEEKWSARCAAPWLWRSPDMSVRIKQTEKKGINNDQYISRQFKTYIMQSDVISWSYMIVGSILCPKSDSQFTTIAHSLDVIVVIVSLSHALVFCHGVGSHSNPGWTTPVLAKSLTTKASPKRTNLHFCQNHTV